MATRSGRRRDVAGKKPVLRCSNLWNIFPPMRIGALVALLCVGACQTRPTRDARHRDSLDFAQLVPRDSTDSTLLIPRVVTEPSVVLFWLRAADTLSKDDREDTFDDFKYYTEQVAPALEASDIKLLATNADTVYVLLPNNTRRAILLSGLDYRSEERRVGKECRCRRSQEHVEE